MHLYYLSDGCGFGLIFMLAVWLVIALSVAASVFKVVGGVLFGSRALFVDALTSIANVVAVVGTAHYYRLSLRPPDEDHHYGHYRLGFTGVLVTLATYSFVAGLSVSRLAKFAVYTVSIYAPVMASVGLILYLAAVVTAKKIGRFFAPYAFFTLSELMESTVVIVASLAGALYSFLIDYTGAIIITAYIFYEILDTIRNITRELSDVAPPADLVEMIRSELVSAGFRVKRIRLRKISEGAYHGDVIVCVDPARSVEEVHRDLDLAEERIRSKYRADVTIHVEPE